MQIGITEEQISLLKSFSVERLTSNIVNKEDILSFKHESHDNSLVSHIMTYGWDNDTEGNCSYYVVKNKEGQIIMYFALQACVMMSKINQKYENEALSLGKDLEKIKNKVGTNDLTDDIIEWATDYSKNKITGGPVEKIKNLIFQIHLGGQKLAKHVIDVCRDRNVNNYRVEHTYPAIEISHICTNEQVSDQYSSILAPQKVGQSIFWLKIVEKLVELRNLVGFQYICVFAADETLNKELVSYYKNYLSFEEDKTKGSAKPRKYFRTTFLCQSFHELIKNQTHFFETYNEVAVDKDAV